MDLKLTPNPVYTNNGAKGVQYDATYIQNRERGTKVKGSKR